MLDNYDLLQRSLRDTPDRPPECEACGGKGWTNIDFVGTCVCDQCGGTGDKTPDPDYIGPEEDDRRE